MENSNTFFNSWLENQNKLMQNWFETSKKFQETMANASSTEKSVDMLKDWMENQKNFFSNFLANTAQSNGKSMNPDLQKQWMDMQTDFAKSMMEYAQNFSGKSMPSNPEDFLKETRKVYEKWNDTYNKWYGSFGKAFEDMQKNIPTMLGKDVFNGIMDTNKAYLKMQEFYAPIYQLMKDGKVDMDHIRKSMDPSRYKEAIETMFEFLSPDKARDMYAHMNQYIQMFYDMSKKTTEQYKNSMEQIQHQMPMFNQMNPNAVMNMAMEFSKQFEKFYSPFHKMMPPSKEKEMLESAMKLQEKYAHYWAKSSQMQQMIMKASENALHEVMDTVVKETASGNPMEFNKFFQKWVGILEDKMIKSFSTDEFSATQGEMLSLGLDIKKSINDQMEFALSPYPVVPKSEFDELLETVHELKRKVRALEKQFGEISVDSVDKSTKKVSSKAKA